MSNAEKDGKTSLIKKQSSQEEMQGGQKLLFGSRNFNLILNVLTGLKRTLFDTDAAYNPGATLKDWQFDRRFLTENAWFGGKQDNQKVKTFKFYDYAPLVF